MSEEQSEQGIRYLDVDDEAAGILAYEVGGKITEDEANAIWKRFDDAHAAGKKIRILAEMSSFPTAEGGVILDKLGRIGTIMSTVERMAIVGDAGWMDLYAKIIDPITKPDIKHFTTAERDAAAEWVRA